MFNDEEQILRILSKAMEPLFPSEITERFNRELGSRSPYTMTEVVIFLRRLIDYAEQTAEGRWTLKRRLS